MTCPLCRHSMPCENNPCGLRNDGQIRRVVIDSFEAKYGVRAPFVPSPHSLTVPGRMTFSVLERSKT